MKMSPRIKFPEKKKELGNIWDLQKVILEPEPVAEVL